MERLSEKIRQLQEAKQNFWSAEFFPPLSQVAVDNLYSRVGRLSHLHPLFVTVSMGAQCQTHERTFSICKDIQNVLGVETVMHLTCYSTPIEIIDQLLEQALEQNIRNILCVRGISDSPSQGAGEPGPQQTSSNGMEHAVDLIRYIKQKHGDKFCLGCAGYPGGHFEAESKEEDLRYLKDKVEAGAEFIITHTIYDSVSVKDFRSDLARLGVDVPVVPGYMPIQSYQTLIRQQKCLPGPLPEPLLQRLEEVKDDDDQVKDRGNRYLLQVMQDVQEQGGYGTHFVTHNLERNVVWFLKETDNKRTFPWKTFDRPDRSSEEVRPIFWSNRSTSYLSRTASWDDYPNGRWGDFQSPAFGEYHNYTSRLVTSTSSVRLWKGCTTIADVATTFINYLCGKVKRLPWFECGLSDESDMILTPLLVANSLGFLTINSQPRVNAAPSSDKAVGWGPPGGYVFQKAYVEFFCSPKSLELLQKVLKKFPSVTWMSVNLTGEVESNCEQTTAVTWGVFVGKEILQPTVVDIQAFQVWKAEAFDQWLPSKPTEPPSVIREIHDTWFLVNLVDNDFVKGELFDVFAEVGKDPDFQPLELAESTLALVKPVEEIPQ